MSVDSADGEGKPLPKQPASPQPASPEIAELSPEPAGRSADENVGLLERTLRGLTARAVLGVPGMPSQRPCAVLAQELLQQAGSVDAAVEKCSDLGGRRWSDATARFVFGFVPFVGGMGVQLEEMWLQVRQTASLLPAKPDRESQRDTEQDTHRARREGEGGRGGGREGGKGGLPMQI